MSKRRLERLLADWPAKVLSLAGAMTLFFFYQLNRLEERSVSVPLMAVTGGEFAPSTQYPRTVRLTIRGEANAIYSIQEADLLASIDLSGRAAAGVARVPVMVEKTGSALGIDPLEISSEPAEVTVTLEPRVSKEVPVIPAFKGFLEPGYELSSYVVEPSRVEVSGPASLVSGLGDVQTEAIDLSGRAGDFAVRARLSPKSPLVSVPADASVQLSAAVRRTIVYRNFQDLAIAYKGLQDGLTVLSLPQAGAARVAAAGAELDGLSTAAGLLEADLSGVRQAGTFPVPVSPRFPQGVAVEAWQPATITVTVGHAPGARQEPRP